MRFKRAHPVLFLAFVTALTGCTDAPAADPPAEVAPVEALTAAAAGLAAGFDYTAERAGGEDAWLVTGSEHPADGRLSMVHTAAASSSKTLEVVRIADELWLRSTGAEDSPEGWGHLESGGTFFAEAGAMIGPATWVPALVAAIVEAREAGEGSYEGVLDHAAVDEKSTGLSPHEVAGADNAGEVPFTATLDAAGNLSAFGFEIKGAADGDLSALYTFTGYGTPGPVEPPAEDAVEFADPEAMLAWIQGVTGQPD